MLKVSAIRSNMAMLYNMLERPSNIFEHVQKHLTRYNMLYRRYITEYNNLLRNANRPNIDYPTCFITCYMTCLNGLLRAQDYRFERRNRKIIGLKEIILNPSLDAIGRTYASWKRQIPLCALIDLTFWNLLCLSPYYHGWKDNWISFRSVLWSCLNEQKRQKCYLKFDDWMKTLTEILIIFKKYSVVYGLRLMIRNFCLKKIIYKTIHFSVNKSINQIVHENETRSVSFANTR